MTAAINHANDCNKWKIWLSIKTRPKRVTHPCIPGHYLDNVLHHVHLLKRIPIVGLRSVPVHGAFRMFNPSLDRDMNLHLIVVNGNVTSSTKVSSVFERDRTSITFK